MPDTKVKTINQYCSVCKDHFDMEEVKQGSSQSVVWLKCPGCQGFLPYMPDERDEAEASTSAKSAQSELALEDLDVESAREYAASEIYQIGDVVHHRSWNDFGKVISKEQLPGNRSTILVHFVRQGKMQLLEGVG